MAVSVGAVPVTGQPLPWVSMGGSSMCLLRPRSELYWQLAPIIRKIKLQLNNWLLSIHQTKISLCNMGKLKVIVSGGGTGGHIFPAISIANELKDRLPETDILLLVLLVKWKWNAFLLPAIGLLVYQLWVFQESLHLKCWFFS